MKTWLLLALYLGDQLLSSLTPFSSGLFALALLFLFAGRSRHSVLPQQRVVLVFLATLVLGGTGALLSGTPISAFSPTTLVVLCAVWLCGAGLQGRRSQLFSPRAAAVGVMLIMAFLLLSRAGWDAFEIVSGQPRNRGAGLFMEPSHLALYLMPLWLIAYQGRCLRLWLIAALVLVVTTSFSASLAALLLFAYGLHIHTLGVAASGRKLPAAAVVTAVLTLGATMPLPITIGDMPVQDYIGDRLRGLLVSDTTEAYNLSSLVVLQGFELAYLSLTSSFGLGVGVGNLGLSAQVIDQSAYRGLINALTDDGLDLNLRDGGMLASKIVGETGVLALGFFWLLKRHVEGVSKLRWSPLRDYHLAITATLVCLLFVRALPYFAAPTCLAIASLGSLASPLLIRRRRVASQAARVPLSL